MPSTVNTSASPPTTPNSSPSSPSSSSATSHILTPHLPPSRFQSRHRCIILACVLIPVAYLFMDAYMTWEGVYFRIRQYNKVDYCFLGWVVLPWLAGHLASTWGHYYRADRQFQQYIGLVTTPALSGPLDHTAAAAGSDNSSEAYYSSHYNVDTANTKNANLLPWPERHGLWGYTHKFWILTGVVTAMNIAFVGTPLYHRTGRLIHFFGLVEGLGLVIGAATGYAAIASSCLVLLLVLRRSMLQSLGYTYAEVLPLHRWLGYAILFFSTVHTGGYVVYYLCEGNLWTEVSFNDTGRSTLNMAGVFAFVALILLSIFSLNYFRRKYYGLFMASHRIMTVIYLIGTVMHVQYYMLWFYILPGTVLLLVDRFVPKMVSGWSIDQEKVKCKVHADADIIRMVFESTMDSKGMRKELKPYYPGDYITLEIPELGMLYHPFTIASYWPEDPYSMTLYVRTCEGGWTDQLAKKLGKSEREMEVKVNVDGVFGDRRHDYLASDTIVIFAAGAAITTFMGLIKAIGAQMNSNRSKPSSFRLYLICTFRTRSELHAYGSFMHQIVCDPRFTSWMTTKIYISRPEKHTISMLQALEVVQVVLEEDPDHHQHHDDVLVLKGERDHTLDNNSNNTVVDYQPITLSSRTTLSTIDTNTTNVSTSLSSNNNHCNIYTRLNRPLPTFLDQNSSLVSTRYAKLDLFLTSILTILPLLAWCVARLIPWEGTSRWCDHYDEKYNTYFTAICEWTYLVNPGLVHITCAALVGYLGLWWTRKRRWSGCSRDRKSQAGSASEVDESSPLLSVQGFSYSRSPTSSSSSSSSSSLSLLSKQASELKALDDGRWSESDVVYYRGRMDIHQHIQDFLNQGIESSQGIEKEKLVTVFGGGPEGFVDMVQSAVKVAQWKVDFHRETWVA